MCRLFLKIGDQVHSNVYDEYIASCSDYRGREKLDVHEKNELSIYDHQDGYGYAYIKNEHFEIRRFNEAIFSRSPIPNWEKIESNVLLAHARRASPNIKISVANNHPFYWYNGDEYVFGHNGTIKSQIKNFDQRKFFLRGTTDSEKYFYAILSAMGHNEWKLSKELVDNIIDTWDYTGANFILSSPSKAWVGVYYRKYPKYYTMKIYKTAGNLIASSCYLPCLGEPVELLKNGTLVEIDIKSLNYYFLE
ncbi:MAG: class II glutamine amidotransferase [Candidatus Thorarchaeota archaeon]